MANNVWASRYDSGRCRHPLRSAAGMGTCAALLTALAAPLAAGAAAAPGPRLVIDDGQAAAAGLRKLTGRHLTLYTDLPAQPEVDDLPAVFDQAVPQWCQYFAVAPAAVSDWHLTAFVMQDKARFQRAGMLPADLPPFPNGYQRGQYFWLFNQSAAYYRRHLFLHEGTHAFMNLILGGLGPPWYAEGMAELLGTHHWEGQRLQLRYLPPDKAETEGWGRIKIVLDEAAAKRALMPQQIMEYGPQAHLRNEPYAWCWALSAFLEFHPRYQARFHELRKHIGRDLTGWFRDALREDWADLSEEWQLFVVNLEYGYDVARAAVQRKPGAPLPATGAAVTVAADRGWQSTGIRLEAGATYRIEAAGRYQIAETTAVWWCEPGGVTIRYYKGRPLGQLLGAVRPDDPPSGLTPLARPQAIGTQRNWTESRGGTLYLKINESAADLGDNKGSLNVRIRPAGAE